MAAFFLFLISKNSFCFDLSHNLNISFSPIDALEEIRLKTSFKSIKNTADIEPAIENTFKALGFISVNGSKSYEKKFSSCVDNENNLSECVVSGKIFYFASSTYSSFNLIFHSGKSVVTSPELYIRFYQQLDKNLNQ